MTLTITVVLFFGLIFVGVPLFFGIGLATVFYFIQSGFPLEIVIQRIEATSESFSLLAIPFFVLAGHIMMQGGAGRRIVKLSDSMVRWLPGGLAIVTVGAAMLFAGMSGSLIADAAAVGSIMIPGMTKKGYDKDYSAAIVASSGSIGVIIPPSIPMVLYGFIAGTSVGELFMAGIVPGLLVGVALMITAAAIAVIRRYPTEKFIGIRALLRDTIACLPALGMIFIILGGIFGGVFTATESAAVAVVYGLLVGFFVYRELEIKDLPRILIDSAVTSATILVVIGVVGALTWGLTANMIPQELTAAVLSFTENKIVILLLINLLLLFFGCIMGLAPALLLTTPLLLPVALSLGIHPLHFGLIVVANLAIGSFTPPVGGALYVSAQIADLSIWKTARGLVPFILANLLVLLLITYVPGITLFVPRLFGALG